MSETLLVTGPIFLIVLLGLTLGRIRFIDDHFNQIASRLVFSICLPALLFTTISQINLDTTINLVMTITLVCILSCRIVRFGPKLA
ncbi:MAG: AEC family transporter [Pseudomonadales bacterium]